LSNLYEILEQLQSIDRAERQLSKVDERLDAAYKILERLSSIVDKEYADVEKLEKMGIRSVFRKVLGDKEQQLEKERQEYLQAVLKYNEHKKSIELLDFEKNILTEKLKKAGNLKKRKQVLLKQHEAMLIKSNSAAGQEIIAIDKDIRDRFHIKREIHEAVIIGTKVSQMLAQMVNFLKTARNWGNYDMAGGGTISTMMKHSNIDKARTLAHKLQHILKQFQDELFDVYDKEQFQISLQIDSFTHFTDIFFDNLITDWIVQKKIRNALNNVLTVEDRVMRIVSSLKKDLEQTDKAITYLEQKKKDVILDSRH